jgi:hypothetical protein
MIIKNNLNPKKAPGYDLITGKVLKELSEKGMKMLTILFNAILRTGIFPDQWKVAQIILIPKLGKTWKKLHHINPSVCYQSCQSYLKKIFLQKLKQILIEQKLILDHQFDFRQEHATVEQVHRVVNKIKQDLHLKKILFSCLPGHQPSF